MFIFFKINLTSSVFMCFTHVSGGLTLIYVDVGLYDAHNGHFY